MRIIIDVNLSPRWTSWLRDAGIEADHWSALGPGDAPDIDIMGALKCDAVILTRDLDFGTHMALNGTEKPSIVQLRAKHVSPELIGDRVIQDLIDRAHDLKRGAVITINLTRTRVTTLPFPPTAKD